MRPLLASTLFFFTLSALAGLAGGPCTYSDFPGTMIVTKIAKTQASKQQTGSAGYEGYEVTFRFSTRARVSREVHQMTKKEHSFTLLNGWHPGPRYLKKYGLAKGKTFACTLSLIKTGTCSPVDFGFKDLDPTDYFESEK